MKRIKIQDTFYEPLLCRACEEHLQPWESYGASLIKGKRIFDFPPPYSVLPGLPVAEIEYTQFKLLLMSMLWRMAAARSEIFQHIALKERSMKKLHAMLKAKDPGKPDEFGCVITIPFMFPFSQQNLILRTPFFAGPDILKFDGFTMISIMLDGIYFQFPIGGQSRISKSPISKSFLGRDGRVIVFIRNVWNITAIWSAIQEIVKDPIVQNAPKDVHWRD